MTINDHTFQQPDPDQPADIAEQPTDGVADELTLADLELTELFGEVADLDLLDFEEQPLLVVDTDLERVIARQREMMEHCFGGIGEERKEDKRMGLALQHLDIEQRHALRLLLSFEDPVELTAHLERCLADPAYGYGERGDQGRTIAQAMLAVSAGDLAGVVAEWLATHRAFQQNVLQGVPFSFLSLYHFADVDNFVPLLQRLEGDVWRLGVEGQGQHRDFPGPLAQAWPQICDTNVAWLDADNVAWLSELKRKVAGRPDTILRVARADRLRKEKNALNVEQNRITVITERDGYSWPQLLVFSDEDGVGQIGLSRLSGHNFYELSWAGGLHVRYFEIGGTTRQKIPFEHIELATLLAETLAAEAGLQAEPVTAEAVEAAYLRRLKTAGALIGPAGAVALPQAIEGKPVAAYRVDNILVTLLHGGVDVAYVTRPDSPNDDAILLRRDARRGVLAALPVVRGRPKPGRPLMTTPLVELDLDSPAWCRAVMAWGAWLAGCRR